MLFLVRFLLVVVLRFVKISNNSNVLICFSSSSLYSVVKDSSYSSGLGVVFIDSFREGQIRNIGQGAYVN